MKRFKVVGLAAMLSLLYTGQLCARQPESIKAGATVRLATASPEAAGIDPAAQGIVAETSGHVTLAQEGSSPLVFAKPGRRLTGTLLGQDSETLWLRLETRPETVRVLRGSVTKLHVKASLSRDRRSSEDLREMMTQVLDVIADDELQGHPGAVSDGAARVELVVGDP